MAEFKEDPELQGNIKLESDRPVHIEVADENNNHGFRSTDEQLSTASASAITNSRSQMNTLDEPVSETIVSSSNKHQRTFDRKEIYKESGKNYGL